MKLLQNKIVEFLASLPNIEGIEGQQAFILTAGLDATLQNQIHFGGTKYQFFQLLVSTLANYGTLDDGRNALKAIIEASKSYKGKDKREYCDSLIQQLFEQENTKELQEEQFSKPIISINEIIPAFEFDHKEQQWKQLTIDKSIIPLKPDRSSQLENELSSSKTNPIQYYILGLPKTGKTTFARHLLKAIANKNGYPSFYLPYQTAVIKYDDIIASRPYINDVNTDREIFAVDNLSNKEESFQWLPQNAKLCIVPYHPIALQHSVYERNLSFIQPLSIQERKDLLNSFFLQEKIRIPSLIIERIIDYSGGIPELEVKLINYFQERGRLPNPQDLEEIQTHFGMIKSLGNYFEDIEKYNKERWRLILGIFTIGKSINNFYRGLQIEQSNDAIFLRKLGIDNFVNSYFIRSAFFEIWGEHRKEQFFQNELRGFPIKLGVDGLKAVFTSDYDLHWHKTIADFITSIMKDHSKRVDWNNIKVNGKPQNLSYELQDGDIIQIVLGRRISPVQSQEVINHLTIETTQKFIINPSRSKNYKKTGQKQRELVRTGDQLCKQENWKEAESFYLQAIKQRSDANWGRVRLANLYRIKGNCQESLAICQKILRSTPNPYASLCAGICHYWSGDITQALYFFSKCLELRNDYRNALYWKARCLLHFNKSSESASLLDQSRKLLHLSNSKSRAKREIKRQTLQEKFTHWLTLYYENYKAAYVRMSDELYQQILKYTYNVWPIQSLPLICLYFYLAKKNEYNKNILKSIEICQELRGIAYDIFLWCELIPWEEQEYSSLRKQDFIEKFFA